MVDLDLGVKLRDSEASIRVALRDVQCPRCNGCGRVKSMFLHLMFQMRRWNVREPCLLLIMDARDLAMGHCPPFQVDKKLQNSDSRLLKVEAITGARPAPILIPRKAQIFAEQTKETGTKIQSATQAASSTLTDA